jgi:NADH-quinone oxidoreductase subunit K
MDETSLLHGYLTIGAILFGLGAIGFLARRNMIIMFLCAEMMLQGVALSLVAWGRYHNDWGGQVLVIFILTVAACEAAVALSLVTMLFERKGTLDIADWQQLREANQAPYVDEELPEAPPAEVQQWPTLPPAGVEPTPREEEIIYRSHV